MSTERHLRGRRPVNLSAEKWRPPPLPGGDRGANWAARLRRFFDLQAGSIWNDLSTELAGARGNVLDVGCGAQPMRSLLGPEANYLGIDTTDAAAHFGYQVPDTKYFAGDVWPVEDQWAELLLCTETLEHVPHSATFLSEAFRCTKAGGKLLLTVPFAARWHFVPHDYWRFTPTSLIMLLGEAGFTDIAVYARGNQYTVASYKVMALILPLLFPQKTGTLAAVARRMVGVVLLPLLVLLACIAHLSLRGNGGDDCLGYTVTALRRD